MTMNMIIKKRQLVTATLALALGAAVFVNWYYTRPQSEALLNENTTVLTADSGQPDNLGDAQYVIAETSSQQSVSDSADFSEAQLNRERARDSAAEKLNVVIKDETSAQSAVDEAAKQLAVLTQAQTLEADIETLITAKTGNACLVIYDGDSSEIIVPAGVLNDVVSAQIKDIIVNKTALSSEKITIIELKG